MVCDQSSSNIKTLKLLGASLDIMDSTDVAHCILVHGQKIPLIFDVPHLVKSVCNNLKKHGLKVSFIIKTHLPYLMSSSGPISL